MIEAPMMKVDAVRTRHLGSANPAGAADLARRYVRCNGNGLCFNFGTKKPNVPVDESV